MALDVSEWLRGLGLAQYAPAFRDNDIDGDVLPQLTADDLIGLGVASIGHRRKLLAAIAALSGAAPSSEAAPTPKPGQAKAGPPKTGPVPEPAAAAAAERRQLTILFCDVVGSTELATRLDPEDLREIIAAYHGCVAAVLTRFGGFVAKYMGDGVLAYFGYPQAHEEDAEQAVRAGLAIVDAVGRLELPERLAVRLGIATGLVVVGDLIGAGAAQEQAVVGETPNLAARLQTLAEPNAIVIAAATRRQIGNLFALSDLGPQALKGFAGPSQAWQVLGESGVASRFEALRSRTTPLIGRTEEVEMLLRRWSQAAAGVGRVVLLSAEPGIGKSRLAEAVEERIAGEKHRRLRYFCSPHHQDSALYPIIGHLERAAGFERDDDPATKRRKLAAMMATSRTDEADLPLLADLLALPAAGAEPSPGLPPQRRKERTFDILLRGLETLARVQPLLMVFEDLHWMDPSSRELLDRLVARVERLPILLIATFRPEYQPPWIGAPHVTMLALSRLGRRDGAALVQQLAGNAAMLPSDVVEEIIERTDGIPLFLEEVTKVVLEAEAAGARGSIAAIPGARAVVPATLQASLMARLDRLGPAAREIAQTGAAIGRDFPYELLASVIQRGEAETRGALDQLVAAGLVFQRGTPPLADYQFKHALVQDTAYGTLLRGPRQALHGRIAAAIESRLPDRAAREPEILAHHLSEAGESERASAYWRKAGALAVRRTANREAIGHFRRALALVEAQPENPERWRAELAILSQLAPPTMAVFGWSAPEAGEVVERAVEVGRRLDRSSEMASAMVNLWFFTVVGGRIDDADKISAELFQMARDLDDPEILLQAHHCAWATRFSQGRFAEAGRHIEAGTGMYDEVRHAHHRYIYHGHDPGSCGLQFGACTAQALGRFDEAYRRAGECLALGRRLDHAPSLANALWRACEVYAQRGETATVAKLASEAGNLAESHGLVVPRAMGMSFLGWSLVQSGSTSEGLERLREGDRLQESIRMNLNRTYNVTLKGDALRIAGRYAEGLEQVDGGLAVAAQMGERSYLAPLYRLRGILLLHLRGSADPEVEANLRQAIAIARQQDAKGWEIGAALALARLWAEAGRRREAHGLLAPVYGWFTEGFDTPELKEARALLASLD